MQRENLIEICSLIYKFSGVDPAHRAKRGGVNSDGPQLISDPGWEYVDARGRAGGRLPTRPSRASRALSANAPKASLAVSVFPDPVTRMLARSLPGAQLCLVEDLFFVEGPLHLGVRFGETARTGFVPCPEPLIDGFRCERHFRFPLRRLAQFLILLGQLDADVKNGLEHPRCRHTKDVRGSASNAVRERLGRMAD